MNPDDFKSALLARLGLTPAPTPAPSKTGQLLAAALGRREPVDPNATDPQSRYGRLMESPFADTLAVLIGRPTAFRMEPRDQPGDLGEYVAKRGPSGAVQSDTIYLTPELMQRRVGTTPQGVPRVHTPESTLAHEMAHRERATGQAPQAVAQQDSVMHDQLGKPGMLPAKYWTTNSNEHYAESFANAITYLRETARERPGVMLNQRLQPTAQAFEREVPGTMLQVQRLLQTPIYANHPLNRGAAAPLVPRDATAVRKP